MERRMRDAQRHAGGSRDVGTRRQSRARPCHLWAERVPALINAVRNDQDWDVREQAANSLGSIGPRRRRHPALVHILNSPRVYDTTVMNKEQMAMSMREEDFRKAAATRC
jgi:hypothetical protein